MDNGVCVTGYRRYWGRRVLLALGGLYVAVAAGFPILHVAGDAAPGYDLIITILVGGSGLALSYGGYRLPHTTIRPDLYHVIANWCLRAIGVMLGILLLVALVGQMNDLIANVLILTSLASVAGFGMGIHDGQAKTRALDAEEQRKEAEKRREEAERYSRELERYETIVETVNDGIFVVDEDNQFILVNDAYTELVGYDREELISSPTSLVVDDIERLADEYQADRMADDTEPGTYESALETVSGEQIEAEATVASLPKQEDADHDRVGVVRDITERNKREQRLKQQNERLDRFASLIAHELRNPVSIGQIYSQQLPQEANPEAMDYVTEAFDRIENMIDVLLVVARGQEAISESTSVQLRDVAQGAWDEVKAPDATLEVTTDQTIEADDTYLRHLFRNLFENAIDHGGGDVTVTVGDLPTGFYVADNGSGIPADDREAIFESGYTTASSHGGMGLGLTFVTEMAKVYEWTYSVTESEAGGAQFEFENVTD